MQQPAPLKLCWQALNSINNFKQYLPLVTCMCNSALQKRHWMEMSAICKFNLTPNAGTSLRKIISYNLMSDIEKYKAISLSANRELKMQQKLLKMIKEWDKISFEISLDKQTEMNVFSNMDDIELLLEDHLIIIEEMKTSNFVKEITSLMTDFLMSLTRIQEIINQWNYIQILVLSLNSTFCHPSIKVHLTKEFLLYKEIKEVLKHIQKKLSETPTFTEINDTIISKSLLNIVGKLEYINEKVKNYIQTKRQYFPRFYFLSDKEIEEILFKSDISIQSICIQKCFEGIQKLKIDKERSVCSIFGDYEEELRLEKLISLNVQYDHEEKWLIYLENEINTTIKESILLSYQIFSKTFVHNSIINFPSMAIVCTFQLCWTIEVHRCLTPFNFKALNSLYSRYINYVTSLTSELKNYSIKRLRNLLMSLITILIQQKDIIQLLLDKNITRSTDFEWVAQLQYYLVEDCIEVSIFNTTIKYGYEYSYYKQHIINTPLTDRCFHTLMQAYKYHLYGAITGPSGTGKSETLKSLAKTIAIQFRSFNCTNTLSYNFLSQVFKGFISCGVWLCFKNFDTLKIDLLSRLAQTLTSIFQIIATNLKITMFEGSSLRVNRIGHICIITKLNLFQYSNLPDNLRILFRTVSMIVPDMNKIIEVEFFAGGISNSKLLTSKLVTLYKILSEQLWCQSCNIFNLYSMKTIVKTTIFLKRSFPDENEAVLLLRSLINVNLPKLCNIDTHIFRNIVHYMFPDLTLLPPNYAVFLETLETVCTSKSIHIHDIFKLKIIQIFELMHIHQCLMIVGNPFVGKTEILNILQVVLLSLYEQGSEFGVNIKLETIVPSTIDVNHLFGHFDEKSKIWKDGICSKMIQPSSKNDSFDRRWIIFDGLLNSVWIENLYAVLDINGMLYLSSDEKMNMTNFISIIFETINMEDISPAILSTCGIIYIESNSIDWRPYVKTYFSKHNIYDEHKKILYQLFDWIIEPCLQFIQKNCTVTLNVGQLHFVMSTLNLFEMYLRDALTENTEEKGKTSHFLIWAQIALILSIIWGLGGNLDIDSHTKFNSFCTSLWTGAIKEYPKPEIIKGFDITLPHEGLIQDNFYIFKGVGNWKYWGSTDILKSEQILENSGCNEIFVPTINTIKYNHMILKHIKYRKPFIICGDESIGKSYLIKTLLRNKLPEGIYSNFLNFISLNTVAKTQQLLLSKLNKIRKRHYGPPKDQFCINFIDDLNMQRYECQSEINGILDLIRQYHSYGYLYDINDSEKICISDIMLSLSIVTNTKIKICPRFLRHFNLYTMYAPATDTIFRIFSNVLFSNLKNNSFTADIFSTVTSITNATIDIYNSIIKTLLPIPTKFQYQFSIRDISRVINGCSLLQKESVETKVTFMRLWAHEVWRVFGDRILDNNDKEWLFSQIKITCKHHFKDSFETAFDYLPKFDNNEISKDSFCNLIFCTFMCTEKYENKRYEEINSIEKLQTKIIFYINEYNNNNVKKRIDIVVSQYILECLIKVSRILAIPGSNLLIISSMGFGRKSLASLAAYMQQQELYEPSVQSYCDFNMWRKDIKLVLQKCGELKQNFILFLKDKQIKNNFLHDICCLLSTGEIPDLFSIEERCDIIEMIRLHAQGGNKNEEISNHAVMNFFLEQCRRKLHIIFCFTETNESIRSYLYKYPELIKYCTVNWYEMWPTDTLLQVGLKYIQDINIEEDIKANVIKICIQLYNYAQEISKEYYKETGMKIHVTSVTYLHMLKLYVHLICKKQGDIVTLKNKYLTGLEKLELAAQQVEKMKATLTILKPQLELSAQKTIITMKEVENENITVEKATAVVQQEEEIANKKTEIAGKLKLECEADLAVAIPILEDAIVALNTLKPTDITLVKAMKNPPDTIKLVMAAICVMLDVPPDRAIDSVTGKKYTDYWGPSKRILSDMNFLQILKDYDKDNIPSNIIQTIKKTYIIDSNFKPHIVAKASSAAEGLCKWVCAMVSYDEVAKAVAPKKEKLLIAEKECNEAEAFLNEKRKTLLTLNVKLAALNDSLQETLQQKIKLKQEVEDCTIKLQKAKNLMASLGGEKNRWMQIAENLKRDYDNLVGDMILTCATINYAASYNIAFRNKILEQWKQYMEILKISYSKNYNLINILGEENNINHWYFSGLPKNSFSVENAIIMTNSKLWSLFIDSQNQANEWIKKIEKKNNLKIIKLTDSNYLSIIRYNVENGIPTLIENVGEELEISLDPFLLKRISNDEKSSYLDIGHDIIKYSFDFRLYITTRLLNPQFSCEMFSKLTIINFSIPNEALQDKLLDFIIYKEKPKLQEKFKILLMEDANNKKILKQQEDIILNILSSTTTNILEDETAIKSLDSSKNFSLNIIKKQEMTKKLILVKILRPDQIIIQIIKMIENMLGNTQNHSPKIKISQSYAESSYLTPLLFILPASLTPLSIISTYANTKGYLSKFVSLSMSKGEEKKAEFLIKRAQKEGGWVFLQNCHLVTHWLANLEKICDNCNISNSSLDYRLWLSSCSINEFPISILQNSIKIMHDYPLNIKETLLNIYQSEPIINKEFFEGCPGKDKIFLKLLFTICLFHVIIQEREHFGFQGWNIPYKFDHTDLKISIMQLQNFINNADHVPFDIFLYLIGECNYGGKIQDEFDSRYLKHLLTDYCNPNIIENGQYVHANDVQELIPQRCEYYHVIDHIRKIPSDLSFQIFGFNRNGIIIRNTMIATELISSLSYTSSPISLLDEELQKDQVLILINDINDKLCDAIKINEIQEQCTSMLKEPLQRVLFCEIKSLKHILEIITKALTNLKLALDGYLLFTDSLKKLAKEICENKTPHTWKMIQINILTENLTDYIDNLLKRAKFIQNWINQGRPKIIWFDTLFHYKMFFSAILLTFSKRYNISIEDIIFDFEIDTKKEIDEEYDDAYLICGLHLCGARWDLEKRMLVENFTNEIWQNMPPIHLKCSRNKKSADKIYECPVYITAAKNIDKDIKFSSKNYIISIPLKTDTPATHWIKCGTALFCHINYQEVKTKSKCLFKHFADSFIVYISGSVPYKWKE
ncbi:dynein axonemal heavy chain 7-like isoform X4 [Bombus flavifrons]